MQLSSLPVTEYKSLEPCRYGCPWSSSKRRVQFSNRQSWLSYCARSSVFVIQDMLPDILRRSSRNRCKVFRLWLTMANPLAVTLKGSIADMHGYHGFGRRRSKSWFRNVNKSHRPGSEAEKVPRVSRLPRQAHVALSRFVIYFSRCAHGDRARIPPSHVLCRHLPLPLLSSSTYVTTLRYIICQRNNIHSRELRTWRTPCLACLATRQRLMLKHQI